MKNSKMPNITIKWVDSKFAWYPIKTIDSGWVWLDKVTKCAFVIEPTYHFCNTERKPLKDNYDEMVKYFYFGAKENFLLFINPEPTE